jgi:1-acyl-sn-glycerol-3-phosphate acyltransferase
MAKEELFLHSFSRWWMLSVGCFAVKRNTADLSAVREAIRRVNKGDGLFLFPEGTRQDTGKFGKPEAGAGFLAAKLDVPVIPAFISGSEKAHFVRPRKVRVYFGKEIQIDRKLPYQDIAEQIMSGIRELAENSR